MKRTATSLSAKRGGESHESNRGDEEGLTNLSPKTSSPAPISEPSTHEGCRQPHPQTDAAAEGGRVDVDERGSVDAGERGSAGEGDGPLVDGPELDNILCSPGPLDFYTVSGQEEGGPRDISPSPTPVTSLRSPQTPPGAVRVDTRRGERPQADSSDGVNRIIEAYAVVEPTAVAIHDISNDVSHDEDSSPDQKRRKNCALVAALCAVLAGAGVAVGVSLQGKHRSRSDTASVRDTAPPIPLQTPPPAQFPTPGPTSPPTHVPSLLPTSAPTLSRSASIMRILIPVSGRTALEDPTSPANRALRWLADEDPERLSPERDPEWLVQRYVLALLYFSTGGLYDPTFQTEGSDKVGGAADDNNISSPYKGSSWKSNMFLKEGHECAWAGPFGFNQGVSSCNADQNITALLLANNGLQGTIPSELSHLTKLSELWLLYNALSGTIPSTLGSLGPSLTTLFLSANALTGTIPTDLGQLSAVETFYIDENPLTGTIPSELGSLSSVVSFDMKNMPNMTPDTIPSSFANLTNLKYFYVSGTPLLGSANFLCDALNGTLSYMSADNKDGGCGDLECHCCRCVG